MSQEHPGTPLRWTLPVKQSRAGKTRDRLLAAHSGRTVVAVSHLTPIKLLTALALDLPLTSLFRSEIVPASVTVVAWYADGRPLVRLLNGRPGGLAAVPWPLGS